MVLVFDNSFSWMREKHVAFKYEVLPPGTSISVRPRALSARIPRSPLAAPLFPCSKLSLSRYVSSLCAQITATPIRETPAEASSADDGVPAAATATPPAAPPTISVADLGAALPASGGAEEDIAEALFAAADAVVAGSPGGDGQT